MSAARLLEHFDRISEAPDAIPKLRRFILDLAVRGKLVEQDPEDGTAGDLLVDLRRGKAELIRAGKIRDPRDYGHAVGDAEYPLPQSWIWCLLSDVGAIVGGGTPPSGDLDNFEAGGRGTPWLTPADLGKDKSRFIAHGARDLSAQGLRASSATLLPAGSVLFTSRAPIGYTAIAANEVTTNQGFKSVVPFVAACNKYIAVYFRAFANRIDAMASGTTFREVSGKIVASLAFPLPPLAEQHRIVAKVDELMGLCDRLEGARAEREMRRDRVVATSVGRIAQQSDGDCSSERREIADFSLKNLRHATQRPSDTEAIRQAVLSLSVSGRLVPQNPLDESAEQLLRRIRSAKAALANEGAIHQEKPLPAISEDSVPFQIPPRWTWVRIGDIALRTEYGTSMKSGSSADGVPVLKMGDIQAGRVSQRRYSTVPRDIEDLPGLFLKRFDLLYNRTNSAELVGKTGIFDGASNQFTFASYLIRIQFVTEMTNAAYVNLTMNAPYFRPTQIAPELTQQCGQANVNGTKLRSMLIPLPPLPEQHRIMAKVDELMALCAQLESQLSDARLGSQHLLDALLHEALAVGV